jgi:bisphosphoglycerate-dependent phosphoglycerate mutase family 1
MVTKKFHIYLFRHGQTTYNRDGRFTGHHNPSLTKLGIKNAQTVAKKLQNKKFGLAIHSRLKRSKQTLAQVLKYHPECKKIMTDDRMIERDYGKLSGTTHEEFIKKIGDKIINLEMEGDAIENLSPQNRKKAEQLIGAEEYKLIHRGFNFPPPGGESFAMVEKRVSSFIKDLKKIVKKNQCNIAISAHGNSIRLFRKIIEHASIKKACSWFIPYDKVFVYSIKA